MDWLLRSMAKDTQKHVTGCDKCMNVGGDCVQNGVQSVIVIL